MDNRRSLMTIIPRRKWIIILPAILILGGLWAPLAAQQEQSTPHEHLWDQYCFDCHQCEDPTPENPCLKGCPFSALDMKSAGFPSLSGPDVMVIDELVDLYEPVVFAHKLHANMSNMGQGCGQCHHYSLPDNVPACTECHRSQVDAANMIQPSLKGAYHRQCLGCHASWDHTGGCSFCHAPKDVSKKGIMAGEKPLEVPPSRIKTPPSFVYQTTYAAAPVVNFHHQEHTLQFGVNCVNCHSGEDCAYCHQSEVAIASDINRTASCFSCHNQDNCGFCHNTVEQPNFRHIASSGWNLGDEHEDLQCAACHGTMRNFTTPQGECGECHTNWSVGNFDHRVTGILLDMDHGEFECEVCHQDVLYKQSPNCEECHDPDISYPKFIPGTRVD
ncbi:cytochrome c3 family protein [Candidatus Neomarinimicrobiota bacterium]